MQVEGTERPLGIDVAHPRMSWRLPTEVRGYEQAAYQVLVSSSSEALAVDRGDVWDSGRVGDPRSVHVLYNGSALQSRTRYHWKVRTWDKGGVCSGWSQPSWWEMGLLDPADWTASWIDLKERGTPDKLGFEGARWIGVAGGSAPGAAAQYRYEVKMPRDREAIRAIFRGVARASWTCYLNGREVGRSWPRQSSPILDLTWDLLPEENVLVVEVLGNEEPPAFLGTLRIDFAEGEPLLICTGVDWEATADRTVGREQPESDDADWVPAIEVDEAADTPPAQEVEGRPSPYLRREFQIAMPVRRARVYASALGLYELRLNGERVTGDRFRPGWTDYHKRIQYQTYDVTAMLQEGPNAVGAVLGDGWYSGHVAMFGDKQYGQNPALLLQMEVEYEDGSRETIVSDGSWQASVGPICNSDILMGETYDARKELTGWDRPGYSGGAWASVRLRNDTGIQLVAQVGPSVRVIEELCSVSVTQPRPGRYIFDMGQNMVGWVRLRVRGEAGAKVRLRFGEMLEPDGSLYTTNLRTARQTDTYVLRGAEEEIYEPHFTYHGFRYVELAGQSSQPSLEDIIGLIAHSETPPTGSFETSSPLLNQLQHNIVWGQRGNFLEVPTDCPQRDERLGWLGDAQMFVRTAAFNMDVHGFFTKWMRDVGDAQRESGAFTDVAPALGFGEGTAGWGDAGIIVPWAMYEVYGDRRILEEHYPAMQRWIGYLEQYSDGLIRPSSGYGDWLSVGAETPKDLIGTAYFAGSTALVAQIARVLGREEDEERYQALFERVRRAFNETYVSPEGRIKGDTQTAYVLALQMGLLTEEMRATAVRYLVEDIEARGGRLSTGFLGTPPLLHVLAEHGHLDTAYRLLNQDEFPSWGYMVRHGATTIWERWDGWTEDKGFQDERMNSFNHYGFGSVGDWMYRYIGGIRPDPEAPGYERIVIRPQPGGGLTCARAAYESIRGRVAVEWDLEGDTFHLCVTLPPNSSATVYVPGRDAWSVTEDGVSVSEVEHVKRRRIEADVSIYAVGSGKYQFRSQV